LKSRIEGSNPSGTAKSQIADNVIGVPR